MDKRSGSPSEAQHFKTQLSTSTNLSDRKIGFFCRSMCNDDCEVLIFSLDPRAIGDDYTKVEPAVKITGFGSANTSPGMCVLNSTLYIFEGRSCLSDIEEGGRSVWKLKLSYQLLGESNYPMKLKDLTKVPDMLFPKSFPIPIPILTAAGHRILVLSARMNQFIAERMEFPNADLELYNPDDHEWEKLPKLPYCRLYDPSGSVLMHSCALLGDSRFKIHTDVGTYIMNLDSADRKWEIVDTCDGRYFFTGYPRSLMYVDNCYISIKDRYLLGPRVLYDVEKKEVFEVKLSSMRRSVEERNPLNPAPAIRVVEEGPDSVFHTLVSRVRFLTPEKRAKSGAHFGCVIDVVVNDLEKLQARVERHLRFAFDAAYIMLLSHGPFII